MGANIRVVKKHNLPLEEAISRGKALLDKFKEKMSGFISDVQWTPDGTRGTASGKVFSAVFSITPADITVDVELKGLGASLLKGQVQSQIEASLEKRFN
ncbi:MAG: hypothetical protein FJ109_13235 [Deltaproteobacteria bacterium]|nr:hypothetical protein [Deltaproteobacteria bacterium]